MGRRAGIIGEVARIVLPIIGLFAYAVGVAECGASAQARGSTPFAEQRVDFVPLVPKENCTCGCNTDGPSAPAAF